MIKEIFDFFQSDKKKATDSVKTLIKACEELKEANASSKQKLELTLKTFPLYEFSYLKEKIKKKHLPTVEHIETRTRKMIESNDLVSDFCEIDRGLRLLYRDGLSINYAPLMVAIFLSLPTLFYFHLQTQSGVKDDHTQLIVRKTNYFKYTKNETDLLLKDLAESFVDVSRHNFDSWRVNQKNVFVPNLEDEKSYYQNMFRSYFMIEFDAYLKNISPVKSEIIKTIGISLSSLNSLNIKGISFPSEPYFNIYPDHSIFIEHLKGQPVFDVMISANEVFESYTFDWMYNNTSVISDMARGIVSFESLDDLSHYNVIFEGERIATFGDQSPWSNDGYHPTKKISNLDQFAEYAFIGSLSELIFEVNYTTSDNKRKTSNLMIDDGCYAILKDGYTLRKKTQPDYMLNLSGLAHARFGTPEGENIINLPIYMFGSKDHHESLNKFLGPNGYLHLKIFIFCNAYTAGTWELTIDVNNDSVYKKKFVNFSQKLDMAYYARQFSEK